MAGGLSTAEGYEIEQFTRGAPVREPLKVKWTGWHITRPSGYVDRFAMAMLLIYLDCRRAPVVSHAAHHYVIH
jgi:hypothetical protein